MSDHLFSIMNVFVDLQLVAVLPNIVQSDDVGMLQKLHNGDLTLQTVWDRFVARSGLAGRTVRALNQIGKTLGTRTLRHRTGDDLDSAILISSLVPDYAHPRTAALADSLAQLPVSDVGLAAASRCIGRCRRNGGVAFRVSLLFIGYLRDAFVLRRTRIAPPDGEGTIGVQRLVVRQMLRGR